MDYITILNSKVSKEHIIKTPIKATCKICGGGENIRHFFLKGYGCYICDRCSATISALRFELYS